MPIEMAIPKNKHKTYAHHDENYNKSTCFL